jgi:hypothetical protein
MRKFLVLPLAGVLLLAAAAPVAAGPNTSNTSGSGQTIQGEWYDESSYGYLVLFEESGGEYGELFEESGEWVLCTSGPTPGDEVYGFIGQRVWGWAYDIEMSLGSKLSSATATAEFEIGIESVDECSGTYQTTFDTASVAVDVVGSGSLVMFRNSGSFKVPGDFNSHSRYRGKERVATGQVDLGALGSREFGFAIMAEYSWSEHANG